MEADVKYCIFDKDYDGFRPCETCRLCIDHFGYKKEKASGLADPKA